MAQILRPLGLAALLILTAAMVGCDEKTSADVASVKIAGQPFFLEIADTDAKRFQGLSGREHIEDDGGMLFIFPPSQVRVQNFVMRDCPIPIDILYLDGAGRVLATYTMQPEPPRGPGEGQPPQVVQAYEDRLKKYSSRFPAQFVIELRGGTIEKIGVRQGDLVQMDLNALKKRVR